MELSSGHIAARDAAARLPAIRASFEYLDNGAGAATIKIYNAFDGLLVSIPLADGVGTLDEPNFKINLTTPIEAQVTQTGTANKASIFNNFGALWASNITVSDTTGSGEIKLATTSLQVGALCRITQAVFQG